MQFNCGYIELTMLVPIKVKEVMHTVKSHGAANTVEIEIEKQQVEGGKLKVITLDNILVHYQSSLWRTVCFNQKMKAGKLFHLPLVFAIQCHT